MGKRSLELDDGVAVVAFTGARAPSFSAITELADVLECFASSDGRVTPWPREGGRP
jgi:hypothetical protein